MNVYTYFEHVPEMADSAAMLEPWKKSWLMKGFMPVVLDWSYAVHSFAWYLDKVSKHPTSNPKEYEMACFKRWAVMASIGGGLLVDYDVVNINLTPDYFAKKHRAICGAPDRCLGLIYCNEPSWWLDMVDYFENYQPNPNETQVSDMTIFKGIDNLYDVDPICFEYGQYTPGDPSVRCVHCSWNTTTGKGFNRMKCITDLL